VSGVPLEEQRPTWAEIDLAALSHNLKVVRGRLAGAGVLAVVKADAYGHGAVPVARRLEREGVEWLGVALPEEGVALRNAGLRTPILVLSGFAPAQADLVLAHELTPALFRRDQAEALRDAAGRRGIVARVHLKIDTGMGRLGVPVEGVAALVETLRGMPALDVVGAFSHLATAEDRGDPFAAQQLQAFLRSVAVLREHGLRPEQLHLANSPAILEHRATWLTLARPGLLLYGYNPDPGGTTLPVRPVLTLKSRLVDVRDLPAGGTVGYGRTWRAAQPARIATLAIGYADGLPRAASNRGQVLVRGRRAPIAGRVSMDLTTIDITTIPEAEAGDLAVLIGRQGGDTIGADAWAAASGTIPWEILARIGPRVPRVVLGDDPEVTTSGAGPTIPSTPGRVPPGRVPPLE
jgi:alanine racemase